MGYFVVILLAISAVYCFFGAFILKIASQKRVLGGKPDNFVYKGLVSLEKKLEHSGSSLTVSQYLAFQFIIPVLAGVLSGLFQDSILTAILLMVSTAMLPRLILAVKKSSEDRKFEDRYARALSQMASALHSGRTIGQAVDTVATCDLLDPQTQKEFMQISSKLKLGHPIPETFEEYAEETGSKDAKDVATAITIMLEVGGDPGKAIEKLEKASEKDKTKYIIIKNNVKDDNDGKGYSKAEIARQFAESFCRSNNVIDEITANDQIKALLKISRNIFDKNTPKKYPILLNDNKTYVYLNNNIWGESTECWKELKKCLQKKDNPYFQIEAMK